MNLKSQLFWAAVRSAAGPVATSIVLALFSSTIAKVFFIILIVVVLFIASAINKVNLVEAAKAAANAAVRGR